MNRTTLAEYRAEKNGVTPEQQARTERRQRLQALTSSPEWKDLVEAGLRAQRRRTMESMAANPQLTERELREYQAKCVLLLSLIARPVEYLLACYDGKGDD